jgi:hypothetical protein
VHTARLRRLVTQRGNPSRPYLDIRNGTVLYSAMGTAISPRVKAEASRSAPFKRRDAPRRVPKNGSEGGVSLMAAPAEAVALAATPVGGSHDVKEPFVAVHCSNAH